jgi:hypothetical protein
MRQLSAPSSLTAMPMRMRDVLAASADARISGAEAIDGRPPLAPLALPAPLAKRGADRWKGARTCNLSAWREDLLAVNGFDESYTGWGLEDSDLVLRLIHAGLRRKKVPWGAPVLHLWHREVPRDLLPENQRLLDELMRSRRTTAAVGVRQHLDSVTDRPARFDSSSVNHSSPRTAGQHNGPPP